MKTMLIVSLGFAASFAAQAAQAANDPPAQDFRAAATETGVQPPTPADSPTPDCGVQRLSLIWGPDRQPGAYECFGRPRTR